MRCLVIYFILISALGHSQSVFSSDQEWISIFDGESLEGWTPKLRGEAYGSDSLQTFVIRDSAITVDYRNYEGFNDKFGHLFYKTEFSSYRLTFLYRFIGEQIHDGPGWAYKNSGIMFHCEPPSGMARNQDFPISLEAQLLGADPEKPIDRSTMNLCTPGTHVFVKGDLTKQHCLNSSSQSYRDDQWIRAELVVYPDGRIEHFVEGKKVMSYSEPILGGPFEYNTEKWSSLDGSELRTGFLALQSESHPVQFKSIYIKPFK
jgi:hypothetical protein